MDVPRLEELQTEGFPMGGEPSAAIDLADTVMTAVEPAVDLLDGRAETWWRLQSGRLPDGDLPEPVATRRLRTALRDALEARIADRPIPATAVDELNYFADSVPSSPRLEVGDGGPRLTTKWHPEHGGNPKLAAVARDAIELMADPDRGGKLRHCANEECSMIFLAENKRRIWCTANICGNRARVARYYRRERAES